MRIFAAGISTESNTFAPWPTGQRGFEEGGYWRGTASASGDCEQNLVARLFRQLADADGHEFVEGLFAVAQPSGPTIPAYYQQMRTEILADIQQKGPFEVVLLYLHGAMVTTHGDACEADLVAHIRALVGPKAVIGVELDPHCHLSQTLIDVSDLVILQKEYPHTDFQERASELYSLCVRTAAGEISPVSYLFDCKMIGFYPTTEEPMAGFVRTLREAEQRAGVLSVSFAHGFPWGDTFDTGSKLLAITDADPGLASELAEALGREIYNLRNTLVPRYPGIDEALDLAISTPGRIVLADTADNAGGGAPSDNTSLLAAILRRGIKKAAFAAIWDPVSVSTCTEAGIGTTLALRLGGKCGITSGDPIDLEVTVRGIKNSHDQAALGASRVSLGASVWLEVDGVDIVVISIRDQIFAPDAFTGLGIDLSDKRLIVVKSSYHFRQHFAAVADRTIQVATPGAIQMNFSEIKYKNIRSQNYFPRVADPLGRA
jgi:microcystin degradation protein MlrC